MYTCSLISLLVTCSKFTFSKLVSRIVRPELACDVELNKTDLSGSTERYFRGFSSCVSRVKGDIILEE